MSMIRCLNMKIQVDRVGRTTIGMLLAVGMKAIVTSCQEDIQRKDGEKIMRRVLASASVFLLLGFLLEMSSLQRVYADGGAPNLAYVSGTATGISVIDVGQSKVTQTLAVPGDPHTILLSLDGSLLYVTQPMLEQVSILAARTGQTLCTAHLTGEPTLLALDPNSNILYAAGNGATRVSEINTANCTVRHVFQTNNAVYGLAFGAINGDENILWVAGTKGVSIFNTQSEQLLATIAIAGSPHYITAPLGSAIAYVTTQQGDVDAIDFETRQVYTLLQGGMFGPMDYDALTGAIYVPDEQHNVIDVLTPFDSSTTTAPSEPERVINLAASPQSVAITNDGLLGFVAMRGGKVAMIDLLGRHVVFTLAVGGDPHYIITGLYPPTGTASLPKAIPTPMLAPSTQQGGPLNALIITLFSIAFIALVLFIVLLIWLLSASRRGKT